MKNGNENGFKVIGTQTLGLRGLVLWLKFNEGSGNIAYDSSFYNNHGTIYGAVWTDGKFGKALSFDGVDDYVKVPHSASLDITDEITVTVWCVVTGKLDEWVGIVAKDDHSANRSWNIHESHTREFFYYLNLPEGGGGFSLEVVPELGKWYFLAFTYDGNVRKGYVNGEVKHTISASGSISSTNMPVAVGSNSAFGENFQGLIDEVRIYNRALTEEEIKMLYFNRIGAVPSKVI